MLTKSGKNWLAEHAGFANCYQTSDITYYIESAIYGGSTGDVANALYVAHLVGDDDGAITSDGKSYNDFKIANGNNDMALDDVKWVYDNEGGTGEVQYCIPPPECEGRGKKCIGPDLYTCIDGEWVLSVPNSPQCVEIEEPAADKNFAVAVGTSILSGVAMLGLYLLAKNKVPE